MGNSGEVVGFLFEVGGGVDGESAFFLMVFGMVWGRVASGPDVWHEGDGVGSGARGKCRPLRLRGKYRESFFGKCMARGISEAGLLAREFARRFGCTVQWARKLEKKGNDPRFEDFRRSWRLAEPVRVTEREPGSELERARRAKQIAWAMLERAGQASLADGADAAAQAALNRAWLLARDAYAKAERHAHDMEVQARLWVSVNDVNAIRSALQTLSEHVRSWRQCIAGRLVDRHRDEFYRAFDESMDDWNEGLRKVDVYIESLLPC